MAATGPTDRPSFVISVMTSRRTSSPVWGVEKEFLGVALWEDAPEDIGLATADPCFTRGREPAYSRLEPEFTAEERLPFHAGQRRSGQLAKSVFGDVERPAVEAVETTGGLAEPQDLDNLSGAFAEISRGTVKPRAEFSNDPIITRVVSFSKADLPPMAWTYLSRI